MDPLFLLLLVMYVSDTGGTEPCPSLFTRYSENHSACLTPNPSCKVVASGVNAKDKDTILEQHNTLRQQLATGKNVDFPQAANMNQLVWDDELEAVAQSHADQCRFEHDCANCRRVQNFGVGQNLAIEVVTNSKDGGGDPNWPSAIKSWNDEIKYFSPVSISPFVAPPPDPTYGHFTQLAWADTWRIGCGFVKQAEENTYKKLYVCNYGPAGNVVEESMYIKGSPCSACPVNSYCDPSDDATSGYPGLCKITDESGPTYKLPTDDYRFYCDFSEQPDCEFSVSQKSNWLIHNTLSGNYLGIVLDGGEKSTLVFLKRFKPLASSMCFVTKYRTGPNVAGQEEAHSAIETFSIPEESFQLTENLPDFNGDVKQQFSEFSMSLGWDLETEFQISFSVPPGKPQQFLEIQKIYAVDGDCPN